jgi:hypothetical protein
MYAKRSYGRRSAGAEVVTNRGGSFIMKEECGSMELRKVTV